MQCFILEHPDGPIAIDTGLTARVRVPRPMLRFAPRPIIEPEEEIGPQLRAQGLSAEDVRLVVITHLDWDHAGGLAHFPNAEVLVHRPEHEFSAKLFGRIRYQPKLWPDEFQPTLYDLDPEPYAAFPESKTVTGSGDVRLVPVPGHSIGQVGVVVETGGVTLFFAADHVLRQDWFLEDYAAGRLMGLAFFPKLAPETSRRIYRFLEEVPTVFVPSHDADARARLEALEPLAVPSA